MLIDSNRLAAFARPPKSRWSSLFTRRQKWIWVTIVLTSFALAAVATWVLWRWAGADKNELAQWIMAAASVLTLLAAGIAAVFAGGALRMEQRREIARELELISSQAARVVVWVDDSFTRAVKHRAWESEKPYAVDSVRVHLRNLSELPVNSVVLELSMDVSEHLSPGDSRLPVHLRDADAYFGDNEGRTYRTRQSFPRIEHGQLPPTGAGDAPIDLFPNQGLQVTTPERIEGFAVKMTFTDAAGFRWVRDSDGRLYGDELRFLIRAIEAESF